jgi:GAF domain-containing protein
MTDNQHSTAVLALLGDYLDEQAQITHRQLGEVAGVAITMRIADAPLTIGSSTELALDVDQVQYQIGLGPCLAALETGTAMYVPDLAADGRWGDYGSRAAERGARCCMSVPVLVRGEPTAVVKAYSGEVNGLTREQQDLVTARGEELAGGIAIALSLSDHAQQLDDRIAAMDHRHVIDLAVGMVMAQARCGPTQAFSLLRRQSQRSGVKLHEVAQRLVSAVSDGEGVGSAHFLARGSAPTR